MLWGRLSFGWRWVVLKLSSWAQMKPGTYEYWSGTFFVFSLKNSQTLNPPPPNYGRMFLELTVLNTFRHRVLHNGLFITGHQFTFKADNPHFDLNLSLWRTFSRPHLSFAYFFTRFYLAAGICQTGVQQWQPSILTQIFRTTKASHTKRRDMLNPCTSVHEIWRQIYPNSFTKKSLN